MLTYVEIADLHGLQPQTIRLLAMRKDWPPCEKVIGRTVFFNKDAVTEYFRTRVDGRRKRKG
jgi:hypothetical protein